MTQVAQRSRAVKGGRGGEQALRFSRYGRGRRRRMNPQVEHLPEDQTKPASHRIIREAIRIASGERERAPGLTLPAPDRIGGA